MIQIQNNGFRFKKKVLLKILRRIASQLSVKGAVTIKIASDGEVRGLNKKYRHKDSPTDVLSFPMGEKLPGGFYAGDIIICWAQAEKQAVENKHSTQKELLLLMIHGLLHLHGLDHEQDEGEMLGLQQQLFAMYAGELE